MANPEHVATVLRGPAAISEWRAAHPQDQLDLSDANLSGAILIGADVREDDLSGAILSEADLGWPILSGANLSKADLRRADLRRADLRGTNLRRANLIEAILSGADLSGAGLSGANLSGADLSGVSLLGCTLWRTLFVGTDLSNASGLDSCDHQGPCGLDFVTLQLSGPLPLPFLRGCGLPERLIEYLPSLLNETFRYNSCFISYSTSDEAFAKRLHADLQDAGVRCWFAPKDLRTGDRYDEVFDRAIDVHDRTLLILSKHSVESEWVAKEVRKALDKERLQKRTVLFPIRIDGRVMSVEYGWAADVRRNRHIGDFTEWLAPEPYRVAFDRLLRDLKDEDTPPAEPTGADEP